MPVVLSRLVGQAAGGDRDAWEQLVETLAPSVWRVVRGYRLDSADAADVFQTVWLRLCEHLDRLRDPAAVRGWVITTATREAGRAAHAHRASLPVEAAADLLDPAPAFDDAVLNELMLNARDAQLWAAFQQLPERCQRLLRLLLDDDVAYDEISATLDMPIGSIGPTRGRCLQRLRDLVDARGITADPDDLLQDHDSFQRRVNDDGRR